jgi:squalene-hopene/tetraprenyl-beta-curcumene cyclase
VDFLVRSVRPDGSWPIDTNLATWLTTLSCSAFGAAGLLDKVAGLHELRRWLLEQQFHERHPYTGADPGGWSWTALPGSVPDADDTPGVLLALHALSRQLAAGQPTAPHGNDGNPAEDSIAYAVGLGVQWLLGLQNSDGGWPTFCRGWGHLPFDRSGADLTAHVLRALYAWRTELPTIVARGARHRSGPGRGKPALDARLLHPDQVGKAITRGLDYLARTQRADGSWLPLWFGCQHAADDENPTYGTARVLAAYRDLHMIATEPARRGVAWLLAVQNEEGGWGGAGQAPSSIEEAALALDVLQDVGHNQPAVNKGLTWLVEQVEAGHLHKPTPIGFYFAKLWYFEKLYPMIFAVAALGKARRNHMPPPLDTSR